MSRILTSLSGDGTIRRLPSDYGEAMRILQRLLAILIITQAAPATADKQKAKEHFESGRKRYDLEKYEEAIKEFEAAYEEEPSPVFLFNIAQGHRNIFELGRQGSHARTAVQFYRKYLNKTNDPSNKVEVEKYVDSLEKSAEFAQPDKPVTPPPDTVTPPAPLTPAVVAMPPPGAVPLESVTPPGESEQPAAKKKWPMWLGIGIAAAAVVAGAVTAGVLLGAKSEPSLGLENAR